MPDYWRMQQHQLMSAHRQAKGVSTVLKRHDSMEMMLISGKSISDVRQLQDKVIGGLITDGGTRPHTCETCGEDFDTQRKLMIHCAVKHPGVFAGEDETAQEAET